MGICLQQMCTHGYRWVTANSDISYCAAVRVHSELPSIFPSPKILFYLTKQSQNWIRLRLYFASIMQSCCHHWFNVSIIMEHWSAKDSSHPASPSASTKHLWAALRGCWALHFYSKSTLEGLVLLSAYFASHLSLKAVGGTQRKCQVYSLGDLVLREIWQWLSCLKDTEELQSHQIPWKHICRSTNRAYESVTGSPQSQELPALFRYRLIPSLWKCIPTFWLSQLLK